MRLSLFFCLLLWLTIAGTGALLGYRQRQVISSHPSPVTPTTVSASKKKEIVEAFVSMVKAQAF